MRHLKKYEWFSVNEEEGWKENILLGLMSLLGVAGMSQIKHESPNDPNRGIFYKTKTEQIAKSMIRRGWSLDSTQIDTLWKTLQVEKPQTEVIITKLMLDKDQYFASGKFELSQTMKDTLLSTMQDIVDQHGIITNIRVVSSTDKQGLSTNLQRQLKSMGYTPDNRGLSKARSESVTKYLEEIGVNDSLIEVEEKFEMGEGEIDQAARYVSVDIAYIVEDLYITPSREIREPVIKKTYYLSKPSDGGNRPNFGTFKFRGGIKITKKKGPIKSIKRKSKYRVDKCWYDV